MKLRPDVLYLCVRVDSTFNEVIRREVREARLGAFGARQDLRGIRILVIRLEVFVRPDLRYG